MDKEILAKYQPIIGLEVHAQLLTNSKAFTADTTAYGSMPNTNISAITLGHPGTLPRLNKQAVDHAIKMGLATNCEITRENIFARKNYFYPDLPKGYQITQDKTPICRQGFVAIQLPDGSEKKVRVNRIHMEEDAGKSMHLAGETETLVDFNRAGVALIEIVSEPDLHTSAEAYDFLVEIKKLVRYLDICDGNMEEGSLRCDANVSVMLQGANKLGTKVEVKNMNSFRNVQRAIDYEIERQIALLEAGESIESETRGYDANTGITTGQRSKETMNDYRYFPEPDLTPLIISDEWLDRIQRQMPSLPHEIFEKFTKTFGLPDYDASVLTDTKEMAAYYTEVCAHTTNYKAASNWMMGPVKSHLNEMSVNITEFRLQPLQLAEIIALVDTNKVNQSAATRIIFPYLLKNPEGTALAAAEALNLLQESDDNSALAGFIDQVLQNNLKKVAEYKAGKTSLVGMFMGEIMKLTKGKADPKTTNKLLQEKLKAL